MTTGPGFVTDGFFIFPEVDVTNVHDIEVIHSTRVDWGSDVQGFAVAPPDDPHKAPVPERGYVTGPNPSKNDVVNQEFMDCVILVKNGMDVHTGDLVNVPEQVNLLAGLAGRYKVEACRVTLLHTRVLCKRNMQPTGDSSDAVQR